MQKKKYLFLVSFLIISLFLTSVKVSADPAQKRFWGINRYATSINICENNWDKSDYVVLVSGEGFADALCAATLAKKYNAPVILTNGKALDNGIKNQLTRLNVKHIFIIGGTGVIAQSVEEQLDTMNIEYERISGNDRYDTSLKVAELIGSNNGVVIASGESFPDALSIAPIAAAKGMSILLTNKYNLSQGVNQFIQNSSGKKFYIVGGVGVIGNNVIKGINNYKRLGGIDRYETNLKIVDEFADDMNFSSIYISSGEGFADALSGSVAAAKTNSPLILTNGNSSMTKAAFYSKISLVNEFRVLGGEAVVPNKAVQNLLTDKIESKFKLGDDLLISKYSNLIKGKNIGLVTNQTGVNSNRVSIINVMANYDEAKLTALFAPEHGIDGKAKAGDYVKSYTDESLDIPVYSLYGATRMPTEEMLSNVDVLVFDIQDIGARSYTYMSTLNYCMKAVAKYNKEIVVLDRPNPLGGQIMDGPVLEDKFKSFVGVDNMPMTHGMTAGELAQFFNRNISAKLTVVPMEGYSRNMIFQDTGLSWVQSSPYIPSIEAVFGYSATGLGEGTTIYQDDYFTWVGGKGVNSDKFAQLLNSANLSGVRFKANSRGGFGGVKLEVTDYHTFNPAKTGIYVLAYAHSLNNFKVPKSTNEIIMFDKIMGTDKIGQYLEAGYSPQRIESEYSVGLEQFKVERKKYLIY